MQQSLATDRAGFTVVEQLVAIVMLGIGLLAIARGIVGLQQHARRAALQLDVVTAAASAIERAAATGCAPASGTDEVGAVAVRWTRAGGAPAAMLTARGGASAMGRAVADSLTSALECQPGA
ncbi:MAG: type II secretion system protein [Gemmatimonadaceae bacterium]